MENLSSDNKDTSGAISQGYTIELYFNPELEYNLKECCSALAPFCQEHNPDHPAPEFQSRPHITLLSIPFVDPSKVEKILKDFASKIEPFPISFGSIGTLPILHNDKNKNILFLAPTPSISLLQFHLKLWNAIKDEGIEIKEKYFPNSWIPYCPVAEKVAETRMAEGLRALRGMKLPVSGFGREIGLVDENAPVRDLFSFVLIGNTSSV